MLPTADLDYELPEGLIATTAIEPRDAARLCVVRRAGCSPIEHARVSDLTKFLRGGDLLVLNSTSVLPAWLEGTRVGTGGKVQGLYLGPGPAEVKVQMVARFAAVWTVMLRGGHLRAGAVIRLDGGSGRGVLLELLARDESEPGAWHVGVTVEGTEKENPLTGLEDSTTSPRGLREGGGEAEDANDVLAILARVGLTPIPPYIRKARKAAGLDIADGLDRERYQTVFADAGTIHGGMGSVAAPTAGLHFTPALLTNLERLGVERAHVVLHVGSGTFRPVEVDVVEDHPIHSEWCSMSPSVIDAIARTRSRGGRVVCVGTTSARVVETYAQRAAGSLPYEEWVETKILITPGYRWRWADGLLTNFHLPRSTLMAMVASLLSGGVEELKSVYQAAIRERYRFYSYGDAMLVMPA